MPPLRFRRFAMFSFGMPPFFAIDYYYVIIADVYVAAIMLSPLCRAADIAVYADER